MKNYTSHFFLAVMLVVVLTSCYGEVKSTPGVYEPVKETYAAYDATVLSGQQVDNTMKRFKESLAIIVVKGDMSYVFGENQTALLALGIDNTVIQQDEVEVVDRDASYHSLVLRDINNEVIAIKLTEQEKTKKVGE